MKKKLWFIIPMSIIGVIVVILIYQYYLFSNSVFELVGRNEVYMNINDTWKDPGYIFKINNQDYNDNVSVENNLLNKEGTYIINYQAKYGLFQKKLTRTIYVSKEDNSSFYLKMNGDSIYYLMKGNNFTDPGVLANDVLDGDLNNKVIVNNNIDTSTNGVYEISYEVTNSALVTKKIVRKVIVYSFEFNGTLKYLDDVQSNEIIIAINDKSYQYTQMPNGEKDNSKSITYPVNENGLYVFKFYDVNNNYLEYEVEVNNIDNTPPTGICTLNLYDTSGEIIVDAKDDSQIKEYIYYYGNHKSENEQKSNYSFNTLDDKAMVEVFDMANNSSVLNCKVVNKATVIPRDYKSYYYNNVGYWLYLPKNNTKRDKVPLLVYLHGDGGRGSNINLVNNYAFPNFISNGMDFPFIMIAPQCKSDINFTSEKLMGTIVEIIKQVSNKYNVDENRIIISGGSSGAAGAAKMAKTYKSLFSCMVIGSGVVYEYDPANLTHLPIWIFHGTSDNTIDFSSVERKVNSMKKAGCNVIFEPKQGGHGVTETAFKESKLINWMISQKRK